MSRLKVLLAEDDSHLRSSLTRLLSASGYEVSGYTSAESLLSDFSDSRFSEHQNCIIMDVNLSGISGVEAQTILRKQFPGVPVIFISAELDAHNVNQAWKDGATEFLFKPFSPESLIKALEKVRVLIKNSHDGEHSNTPPTQTQLKQAELIKKLTFRQLQVLEGLVQGYSNTRIGEQLQISTRTVKMHREGIMRRLGLSHIAELVRYHEQNKQNFPKIQPSTESKQ